MKVQGIDFDETALQAFCRHNRIARFSLFGSILRDDFTPTSDVDILVEFEPGARVSLFDLGGMAGELEALVGREVDLRTPMDLSEYFRKDVLDSAVSIYGS